MFIEKKLLIRVDLKSRPCKQVQANLPYGVFVQHSSTHFHPYFCTSFKNKKNIFPYFGSLNVTRNAIGEF